MFGGGGGIKIIILHLTSKSTGKLDALLTESDLVLEALSSGFSVLSLTMDSSLAPNIMMKQL